MKMKITVAPDSLKESLSSAEAARAISKGVLSAAPAAQIVSVPMADGGEGTTQALMAATGGRYVSAEVSDPLGRPVQASFGLCGDGETAVVEMAAASGLPLLRPEERDPMLTSTRGTGQLIRTALDCGAREVIVGIGGSATVDCGIGMAAELGVRFLDRHGEPIADCCGGRLKDVCAIDMGGLDERILTTKFSVACDVRNPLTGPRGAAYVYGPQKGADTAAVEELERGLDHVAQIIERDLGKEVSEAAGAGAAGGVGAGLLAFFSAELTNGVETVMDAAGLRQKMKGSSLVITAEGCIDAQSAFGKTPAGVAAAASEQGIPVVALAGALKAGYEDLYPAGVTAVFCILEQPMALQDAMARAAALLASTAERVMRLWLTGLLRGERCSKGS